MSTIGRRRCGENRKSEGLLLCMDKIGLVLVPIEIMLFFSCRSADYEAFEARQQAEDQRE